MTLMETPSVTWSLDFMSAMQDLDPVDSQRAIGALERLAHDPKHPSLHMEKLNGKAQEFKSIRASQSVRIVLVQEGNAYFAVDVGQHDEVYRRAERRHFVLDPHRGVMRLIEIEAEGFDAPREPRAWVQPIDETRRPLDHWTNRELKDAGFDDDQVIRIRACQTDEDLLLAAIEDVLLELALELLGRTPESYFAPSMDPEAEATRRALDAIESFGALAGFSQFFSADELARSSGGTDRRLDDLPPPGSAGGGEPEVRRPGPGPGCRRYRQDSGRPSPSCCARHSVCGGGRWRADPLHDLHQQLAARVRQPLSAASCGGPNVVEFINIDKLATRLCAESGQRANVSTRDPRRRLHHGLQTGSGAGHSTRRCRLLSVLPAG